MAGLLCSAGNAPTAHLGVDEQSEVAQAARLPLIELPVAGSQRLAIVLSGDGGWTAMDKGIAAELNRQGISVLGWNSLRYFWREKKPQQVADDLALVMRHYQLQWQADDVALIGYSFGADVLPFVYPRLPPSQRAKVRFMSLLGMAHEADFSVRIGGWLGLRSARARAIWPMIGGLRALPVQCIHGEKEKDSLCRDLHGQIAEVVQRPGGHHFDRDTVTLAQIILRRWQLADDAQE